MFHWQVAFTGRTEEPFGKRSSSSTGIRLTNDCWLALQSEKWKCKFLSTKICNQYIAMQPHSHVHLRNVMLLKCINSVCGRNVQGVWFGKMSPLAYKRFLLAEVNQTYI